MAVVWTVVRRETQPTVVVMDFNCDYFLQDDDSANVLCMDFEIGNLLRENVVPYALYHYTHELTDNGDLGDDYDGDYDEDEEV